MKSNDKQNWSVRFFVNAFDLNVEHVYNWAGWGGVMRCIVYTDKDLWLKTSDELETWNNQFNVFSVTKIGEFIKYSKKNI